MIEVINLKKSFKESVIFENVNVKFEKGNIYGIIGKNGSGKSVFLKILAGLYYPTSGSVLYDKVNYNKNDAYPPSLRAFIDKPHFFNDLNAYDNLKVLTKLQNKADDKKIKSALDLVNLKSEPSKRFSKFSQGMKQKLALAAIFVEESETIFLDEPFNAIEEETVNKIVEYINSIKKGKIILITSHHKEDLEKLKVDKVYKFEKGKMINAK
ncbi:MAG: ABC transporter ATP-binding protein [Tenericutes bacterium]|nr:ABC transporter ATP-binding protein [Mycoplasmatota bacterium]